jgi:hypothetical protein
VQRSQPGCAHAARPPLPCFAVAPALWRRGGEQSSERSAALWGRARRPDAARRRSAVQAVGLAARQLQRLRADALRARFAPPTQALFVLYEAASGYALFESLDTDEIAQNSERVQEAVACVPLPPRRVRRARLTRAARAPAATWRASASC